MHISVSYTHLDVYKRQVIDSAALKLYEEDPALAVEFLTKYCNENVETVRDAWWELLDFLAVSYTHLTGIRGYNGERP